MALLDGFRGLGARGISSTRSREQFCYKGA